MANVIPPDHVDDLPVVEPNQPDDVPVIPEHVLVDEDEDPEEEEFEEEEEPQEEEDDIGLDIKEDENEPKLTYPYEEVDPLNPSSTASASDSEPEDVIEIEDTVEPEDETVPASVHEVGESSTTPFLQEDSDGLLPGLTRRDIKSLFGRMTSLSRRINLVKNIPFRECCTSKIADDFDTSAIVGKPASIERLKADNTARVNQIVTIFLIKFSINILDQNRYPVDTSLIRIESRKSPTKSLFDIILRRISIVIVNTKEYHSDVLAVITRIMRRTL
ncbi:hypothetical protein Tco_0896390 [Tanacetum coccineum]